MMSGGGLTTLEIAARFPVRLVESGPAGGALLSSWIARERALERVLSFDMGGTTAKICLIDGGEPERARTFEVARAYRNVKGSGLPVRVPVIEMVEIGAGGGSIARVDRMQRITVGPDSAGADPGPASYGRGGSEATVTDADLVLGRIDPERFADGALPLDAAAAERAVATHVGAPLRLEAPWAAAGVSEIVEENMANAARAHLSERGADPRRMPLFAFGGAGPVHADGLARKLGVPRILVPRGAGVFSALGFLVAPVSFETSRTRPTRLGEASPDALETLYHELEREATLRALEEARRVLERELRALNELRQEVTDDRGQLVQQATYDAKMDAVATDFKTIRDDLGAIRQQQANQQGRQATWMVVLTITLALVTIGSRFIG